MPKRFEIFIRSVTSAAVMACSTLMADELNPRPNILLIMIDDLNDWVGVMEGHPNARTPNIDRLASRGTLFMNAHASAPLCGPTRAAILSGLRPSSTGVYGHNNVDLLWRTPAIAGGLLLPEYFARHGYKTLSTGKIFHEGSPSKVFEEVGVERMNYGPRASERLSYTPPEGQSTSTDWGAYPERDHEMPDYESARWAIGQLKREHDRAFFLSVGFIRPHVPWFVPQKWFDLHPIEEIVLPPYREDDFHDLPETARRFANLPMFPKMEWMKQEQRWERSVQAYLASTTFVDHCVGELLDALEQSDHADNTVIILSGDHGYHLGEKAIWAKHTLWERSTRIPLIIVRPEDREGRVTTKPVSHLDLYPTLLSLGGFPPNPRNEGRTLVPLLDDPDAEGYPAVLTTHGFGNHAVRAERWRYIRYADGAEELYDHAVDSNEWRNLADQEEYKPVIADLRRHLPETDAAWIPEAVRGGLYNEFFEELFERSLADQ